MKQMLLCHCVHNHASFPLLSACEVVSRCDMSKVELHACFLDDVIGVLSH